MSARRVHRLELYTCTHDVWCVGCFTEDPGIEPEDEAPAEPRAEMARPEPGSARSERVSAPVRAKEADPAPILRPALLQAEWLEDGRPAFLTRIGRRLRLLARSCDIPPGTPARISIETADGGAVAELSGEARADQVAADWSPEASGRFRFTVRAAGAACQSGEVEVGSWTRIEFLDGWGHAVRGLLWRLTDRDGSAIEGRTGPSGFAEWEGHALGPVRLDILSIARSEEPERSGDLAEDPPDGPVLAVGGYAELADMQAHAVRIDRGLVFGLRVAPSDLRDAGVSIVVVDERGAEIARQVLEESAVPRGDHVRVGFPGVPASTPVSAYLECAGGRRLPFFLPQRPPELDVRVAERPRGEILDGAIPETQAALEAA